MSMATYIKDDLSARLRAGEDLSEQLTLDSLAEHYQVSFSPVRAAVTELIAEGLLEKGPNRRLAPRTQPKRSRNYTAPPPPEDPFEIIANDLVLQSLEGEAVYLREEATAEKYGISRSAGRNILHRLAGANMLDHIPRRGWRLRPFRQEDMQAFIDVREVLELRAFDSAQPHLVAEDLQAMLDRNVLPDEGSHPRVDESLHGYLIDKSKNPYIKEFFEQKGRYYRLLFRWEDHDRPAALDAIAQHREILTALLNEDWKSARESLSHHIRCNHPVLEKIATPESKNEPSP